jgi:hypothetical protein
MVHSLGGATCVETFDITTSEMSSEMYLSVLKIVFKPGTRTPGGNNIAQTAVRDC